MPRPARQTAAARRAIALALVPALAACVVVPIPLGTREVGTSQTVTVPAVYKPPPGACRAWYPDRAPEQQPGPVPCAELEAAVPEGAALIRG